MIKKIIIGMFAVCSMALASVKIYSIEYKAKTGKVKELMELINEKEKEGYFVENLFSTQANVNTRTVLYTIVFRKVKDINSYTKVPYLYKEADNGNKK